MKRFKGMLGLGDNLYQRAVLRRLPGCELETPWPQLYQDFNLKTLPARTNLRTQKKNIERKETKFDKSAPRGSFQLGYDQRGSILESLFRSAGLLVPETIDMSGPPMGATQTDVIVVRPATIRKEWRADARNPHSQYLKRICDALKNDFTIVSVADVQDGEEWFVGELPFAHETYHGGELPVEELMKLVEGASGTVGGVGWITPASMAYKTPHICVFGGWGSANGPQRIFDRRVDTSMIVQALPERFCMCSDKFHDCEKTIEKIDEYIEHFYTLAKSRSTCLVA